MLANYLTISIQWMFNNLLEIVLALCFGFSGFNDSCLRDYKGVDLSLWLVILASERVIVVFVIIDCIILLSYCFPIGERSLKFLFVLNWLFNIIWYCFGGILLFKKDYRVCLMEENRMAIFAIVDIIFNLLSFCYFYSRIFKVNTVVQNEDSENPPLYLIA